MHELAITQSMFELVKKKGDSVGAKRIRKINLVIGELTGFVHEYMRFYFNFLSKGTIAEGAEFNVKSIPATGRCRNCDTEVKIEELGWTCPRCSSNSIELVAGKELFVESIEVD